MGIKIRKTLIIQLIIFILIIAITGFVFVPLQRKIEERFLLIKRHVLTLLETTLDRKITYAEVSPSFFRSIKVKGLKIYSEGAPSEPIIELRQIRVFYRLLPLMRGSPLDALYQIRVENSVIAVDKENDSDIIELITDFLENRKNIVFPNVLFVGKNLRFSYKNEDSFYEMRRIFTRLTKSSEEAFQLQLRGNVAGRFPEQLGGFNSFDTDVQIFGTTDFRSADLRLRLRELETNLLSIEEQNFRFTYNDKDLRIQKIQGREPIDISAVIDLRKGSAGLTVLTEDFYPNEYGILHTDLPNVQPWLSTKLSGTIEGEYIFATKELDYAIDIEAHVDNNAVPFPLYAEIIAEGNFEKIRADRLLLQSYRGSLVYSGSFDLNTFMPYGVFTLIDVKATEHHTVNASFALRPHNNVLQVRSDSITVGDTDFTNFVSLISIRDEEYEIRLQAGLGEIGNSLIAFEGNLSRSDGNYLQGVLRMEDCGVSELLYLLPNSLQNQVLLHEFSDFTVNTEVFFTTDFSQYAYVFPYFILASEIEPKKKLSFSLAGNSETVEMTNIQGSWENVYAAGNFTVNLPSAKRFEFTSRLRVNGLPYSFSGIYETEIGLLLEGSYNTRIIALKQNEGYLLQAKTKEIPFQYRKIGGSLNLELFGLVKDRDRWKIYASELGIQDGKIGETYDFSVNAKAVVDQDNVYVQDLEFSDSYSNLSGRGQAVLNGIAPVNVSGWMSLSDESMNELYTLSGTVRNRNTAANVLFKSTPLQRLQMDQLSGDASGSVVVSGPVSSPQVVIGFETKNATFNKDKISLSAEIKSTKELIEINALNFTYLSNKFGLKNSKLDLIRGNFSLEGDFSGIFQGTELRTGIAIKGDTKKRGPRKKIGDILKGDLRGYLRFAPVLYRGRTLKNMELRFSKQGQVFSIQREPDENITAKIKADGYFEMKMTEPLPFQLYATGRIEENKISADVKDINLDIEALNTVLHIPYFDIKRGTGKGNLKIKGSFTDPDFSGKLQIIDGIAENPLIPVDLGPFQADLLFSGKNFTVPMFYINANGGRVAAKLDFIIDHWVPKYYSIDLQSVGSVGVPMESNFSRIFADGEVLIDIVLNGDFSGIDISGTLIPKNMRLTLGDVPEKEGETNFEFDVDLTIETGRQIEFMWPATSFPILQTYAEAGETVEIAYNSLSKSYSVIGDVSTRGGQIFYFNRNFLLREARISFNEEEGRFDPHLTARAELREITDTGEDVTIIMIIDEKPFSQFSPRFVSEPPLPSNEVLALLGQNILTQMGGEEISLGATLALTGNIFLKQLGLMSSIESTIRDILRLDLFSIRSQMLENLLSDRFFSGSAPEEGEEVITLGRYLDNTTLFLGKYLSEDIFLEAMLGLRLKQANEEVVYSEDEFLIDTEISLEWKTPLALLEFSFMPDVRDLFGTPPAVSLALSWGFSF